MYERSSTSQKWLIEFYFFLRFNFSSFPYDQLLLIKMVVGGDN